MNTTFTATVSASSEDEAHDRVERRLTDGFETTGRVVERSARHLLWAVEVEQVHEDADVDDLWFMLTSYGISPSKALQSGWQNVAGLD